MKIVNQIFLRSSNEYRLAEKIVHLTDALNTANSVLNKHGKLGVLPDMSISFSKSKNFHKRVKSILEENLI